MATTGRSRSSTSRRPARHDTGYAFRRSGRARHWKARGRSTGTSKAELSPRANRTNATCAGLRCRTHHLRLERLMQWVGAGVAGAANGRWAGRWTCVSDIPKWAISRSVKLATLPLGVAGRATVGLGKRIGGRPAEIVASELQARTAEQLFRVLGELKGGAMKFGQALSVFEAALPEDLAGPYRSALTKLQEAAPPMPPSTVHKVLAKGLGPDWRSSFAEFSEIPAAAASIGQVHRARWQDGREVAVKLQYPGAGPALLSDLNQLARVARLFAVVNPRLDVKPLLAELKARVAEELDYSLEASSQETFAAAYDGDPDILVPHVVHGGDGVLVSEWVDGTPLSTIIRDGTTEQRDRAGLLFVRFLFSGPSRAGLLHADPHPGNYRLTADGRLAVLDYGAVNRLRSEEHTSELQSR